MTPEEAIRKARAHEIEPVYLVVGPEHYVAARVVAALREAALATGLADFNEDKLIAGEADVDRVLAAVRVAPMMAKRRFVLVHSVERWEPRTNDDDSKEREPRKEESTGALDRLAQYATAPVPETCLVLWASKLDGRRKLLTVAKKQNFLVSCEPLTRQALPVWIAREAKAKGNPIEGEVADLLAEIAGPELGMVADALERVALFVGPGQPITEEAISTCVVRVRQATVWELVAAVGRRDLAQALLALEDVYDPRDHGLRLVGVLAWSIRQLIRFDAALKGGARPEEAAQKAGAPSFKARELAQQVRIVGGAELGRWLLLLAETDLALKGSKRPARAVLEDAIMQMCAVQV